MTRYRLLTLTGSVPTVAAGHAPVTASMGDLNVLRSKEKNLYRRLLLGTALMSDVGESGPAGTNPAKLPATPPSWTQSKIGVNHAYSLAPFSASQHPVRYMNCYYSGSQPLELSAVPASQSLFYEKKNRYVKLVYKLSASVLLPRIPSIYTFFDSFGGQGIISGTLPPPCKAEVPNGDTRAFFIANSGSYQDQTVITPAIYEIFVPDYGKIRDIKVWVEYINDARFTPNLSTNSWPGLGNITVALQSPNVRFKFGRPLWNDPRTFSYQGVPIGGVNPNNYFPPIYENSYMLWDGNAVGGVAAAYAGFISGVPNSYSFGYSSWDTDLDMRTIFSDSAPTGSPLDQSGIRDASGLVATGNLTSLTASSPSSFLIDVLHGPGKTGLTGSTIPWMYDNRIKPGAIASSFTGSLSQTPPVGWMNGAFGTSGLNEFPTSGQALGPNAIRPLYPLLDDVYEKLAIPAPNSTLPSVHPNLIGFRPGLRGTEIHGVWRLKIGSWLTDAISGSAGYFVGTGSIGGWWFRQFRLEFTVDVGKETSNTIVSKRKRFDIPSHVERGQVDGGLNKVAVLSGSAAWSLGTNIVYTAAPDVSYGRSIGISSATGSTPTFAVFSRLTGALADSIGENPSFYLKNEFGTPYIPISSGSSVPQSSQLLQQLTDADVQATLSIKKLILPTTLIPQANTLRAALARTSYSMTMMDKVVQTLSMISGSS